MQPSAPIQAVGFGGQASIGIYHKAPSLTFSVGEPVAYVQVLANGAFFDRHRRSATMHNVLGLGAVSISLAWTVLLQAFGEL